MLPDLVDIARRASGIDRAQPLVLAGAIMAGDWPAGLDRPHLRHAAELARLTGEALSDAGLGADPDLSSTCICCKPCSLSRTSRCGAAEPAVMTGLAKRLYDRARADGQHDVATKITYLFGRADCAECGAIFPADQAVAESRLSQVDSA